MFIECGFYVFAWYWLYSNIIDICISYDLFGKSIRIFKIVLNSNKFSNF